MLVKLISHLNIENNVHLLGLRDDMPNLTSALDILVSSSCGEGFPNVVGEAMACGVPCVVTNAGDSARIVGDTGFVVIQKSPEALAEGIKKIMRMSGENREKMGMHARQRIIENYSINKIVKKYEKLYDSVPSL
jgi:glycosyltransferase involved in cell wall biosynthesis